MTRISIYCYIVFALFLGFACTEEEEDRAEDNQIDESLLYGKWKITEA